MKSAICLLFSLLLLCNLFTLEIPFSEKPVISEANLLTGFVRVDPDDKIVEKLPTQAWLWHDEESLFIRYEAVIDGTFEEGSFAARDSGGDGDYLRVQVITIPEAYYAYYYCAYPSGSLMDGIRSESGGVDYNWNSVYSYETAYDDTLWTVTIRLPFKDLRFGTAPPYNWKIILTRYLDKGEEFYSKPYAHTKMGKDYFAKAQEITLTHKIKRSSDWKFKPYFVKSYDLVSKTDTFDPEHVGMDISFSPSTRTKLKVALNPDFSDVPPDNAQNDYNSKYPPWYMENRFFFTEDIDAFGVDYGVFYTRHIAQPQIAVKFTGNSKTWNYGYLCAKDKQISDNGALVNADDFYQMASLIKTAPRFKVVTSVVSRMNDGYYNHIGVAYWNWEFIKNLHAGTSHMKSVWHKDNPEAWEKKNYQDDYLKAFVSADPGNWDVDVNYNRIGKDLKIDTGTFYDTGYEDYSYNISWYRDTKEALVKDWGFSGSMNYSNILDDRKSFNAAGAFANAWINFKPDLGFNVYGRGSRELWQNREFDTYSTYLSNDFDLTDDINYYLSVAYGKTLIYNLSETHNFVQPSAMMGFKIGKNMVASLQLNHYEYFYDRINYVIQDTLMIPVIRDVSYQICYLNLRYNFSNAMSIRNGLSIDTYDADGDYADISFYSNFRYEFKKDWFLYLGYKTKQYQDEPSDLHNPQGHYLRSSASAYLKLSATL